MGYYGAPGNMAPPPVSLEAMMYGMGAPPGGGGYVDYEAMYRELQLRMYAQQQQQGGMRPSPGGSPHPHSPHQPPLPPGRAPPSMMPGGAPTPGDHSHTAALTAEALRQYQAAQASGGVFAHGSPDFGDDGGTGGWEEGDDEDSSTTTDGSKQSVARRRHARRRRQLARLAADKMEWESRSRQMEAALLERGGDLNAAAGGGEDASRSDASLFADFRAALARALLITEEVLDREDALGDAADGDRWTENKTGTNTETAESDELASRLLEELRDDDDADAPSRTDGDERDDGSDAHSPPRRRSFERRRASFIASDAPYVGSVSFANFLSSFTRNDRGVMVSPHHGRGAFDGRVAGMEAVVALEHGLLKAEASGLFAPGELLVTAVSTKDMLTCYAGGGCENVLGAPAESFIHTSLLDGLHAEDVRNLVFAFHLFPTILPEVINRVGAPRSTARKPRKDGVRRSGAEGGADDDVQSAETPAAGSEPWAKEREKMRARAAHDAEGVLPLPDAAQLLPHGYLRRRLADGRFVAMERLGGMIVSNDTAASVLEEARKPSVEELSTLFGGGNRSPENNSPPEQRTHSLSRWRERRARRSAPPRSATATPARRLGAQRPTSLDETKAVTGAFDGMALADEKAKEKLRWSRPGGARRRRSGRTGERRRGQAFGARRAAPPAPAGGRRGVLGGPEQVPPVREAHTAGLDRARALRRLRAERGQVAGGRSGGTEPGGVLLRVPERRRREGALGARAAVVGAAHVHRGGGGEGAQSRGGGGRRARGVARRGRERREREGSARREREGSSRTSSRGEGGEERERERDGDVRGADGRDGGAEQVPPVEKTRVVRRRRQKYGGSRGAR